MRLINADALLEAICAEDVLKVYQCIKLVRQAPTVEREGWVSVPIENIEMVKHHADFQVTVGFKSCRAAGEFKQALEAAPKE
jgi:hypothetical protein